jgi:hypothetical protein
VNKQHFLVTPDIVRGNKNGATLGNCWKQVETNILEISQLDHIGTCFSVFRRVSSYHVLGAEGRVFESHRSDHLNYVGDGTRTALAVQIVIQAVGLSTVGI